MSRSTAGSVSIGAIVVNWNNATDTLECLDSLRSAIPRPARVVIVDNGSHDGSSDRFTEWAAHHSIPAEFLDSSESVERRAAAGGPWLSIVAVGTNLGFAGGNNVGLTLLEPEASLTHFLLVNNDAVVAPSYFAEMTAVLAVHQRAGLSIGTIYEFKNQSRVWYAGGRILPLRALVTHELRVPETLEPVATEFVTGCAMVISRAALNAVGMLAECYFPGYMEDAEYSWRVQRAGLELIYAPRAIVYHKVGTTFGARDASTLTAYHQSRHRMYFARRNLRGTIRAAALAYMLITKPGRALIDLCQGRRAIGGATVRGMWAGLTTRAVDRADSASR